MIYEDEDFRYCPETGQMWHNRDKLTCTGGVVIKEGTLCSEKPTSHGYKETRYKGKSTTQHRLAWYLVNGYWPKEIDHINGDPLDNRLNNLRLANREMQAKNSSIRNDNRSGYPGIWWDSERNKWETYIRSKGKRHHLGRYDDWHTAFNVRKTAEVTYGYHPNHGRGKIIHPSVSG